MDKEVRATTFNTICYPHFCFCLYVSCFGLGVPNLAFWKDCCTASSDFGDVRKYCCDDNVAGLLYADKRIRKSEATADCWKRRRDN